MKVIKNYFIKPILPPPVKYAMPFIFIIAFSAAVLFPAGGPSVNASVTPLKGTVGQPFTYSVVINGIDPSDLKITLPDKKTVYPEKTKTKNTEDTPGDSVPVYIINSAARDDSAAGEIILNITLTYYRPGKYTLPEIKIAGNDGISIGYKIPSVTIEETNSSGSFEEIEPPVSLSGDYSRLIWIIISAAVLAGAGFFIYRHLKKKRKPVLNAEPAVPPIEIFLREVEKLKLKELITGNRINEYVFTVSIIFRRYLSATLNFDAAEMTTDEISSVMKKYMPGRIYSVCGDEIISNMKLWDLSKFAEFAPSHELLLENLEATVSVAKKIHELKVEENASPGV